MPLLATFDWVTPADFLVERSVVWGINVVWWNMCAISIARETTLRETPFGGYRLVVGINPDFWDNTSSAWPHDQIVTDFYAIAPGGSTPIGVGTCKRQYVYYPTLRQFVLNMQLIPNGNTYMFWRFPPASDNAGLPLFPAQIPHDFYSDPAYPGIILPTPFC